LTAREISRGKLYHNLIVIGAPLLEEMKLVQKMEGKEVFQDKALTMGNCALIPYFQLSIAD